jgi:hypothetical protein
VLAGLTRLTWTLRPGQVEIFKAEIIILLRPGAHSSFTADRNFTNDYLFKPGANCLLAHSANLLLQTDSHLFRKFVGMFSY